MDINSTVDYLQQQGILMDLELYFARFIVSFADEDKDLVFLATLLLSHFSTQGHTCIDLALLANSKFPPMETSLRYFLQLPTIDKWLKALKNCRAVGVSGDYTPLILDKHRLYLHRYWEYEQQLTANLRMRLFQTAPPINQQLLQQGLSRLFPTPDQAEQRNAAQIAILRQFCIISGGPGTGKTSLIIKILALLLEQNNHLNIALAAPTGKATARLQEILKSAKAVLNCAPTVKAALPVETYTLHRLLGSVSHSPYFRSHAAQPLPYEVVVVDEASMVDLALMTKLAQAIPLSSRWLLLGDKDQLASVEAGTVLGDICAAGQSEILEAFPEAVTSLNKSITFLYKNYRFNQENGIGKLAEAVKQGQGEAALRILKSDHYPEVSWQTWTDFSVEVPILKELETLFENYFFAQSPADSLQILDRFCLLCALRQGRYSVNMINRLLEQKFSEKGWIPAVPRGYQGHYHGRPIMITRNDYRLKLFNGDRGIILRNPAHSQELQAYFLSPDGQLRTYWPPRLPEHETAYAMTIHNSQGAEFDNVLILLPEQPVPLLTRELIYTAITRARQTVTLCGNEPIFKAAVAQQLNRTSGLCEALLTCR